MAAAATASQKKREKRRKKIQEITKQADHALISKLAVEESFHYLTQIHTDVLPHTQTKTDSNLKVEKMWEN